MRLIGTGLTINNRAEGRPTPKKIQTETPAWEKNGGTKKRWGAQKFIHNFPRDMGTGEFTTDFSPNLLNFGECAAAVAAMGIRTLHPASLPWLPEQLIRGMMIWMI
jgi:hypothetical protein